MSETAMQANTTLHARRLKAVQNASQIIHELRDYIADRCFYDARNHLIEVFEKVDVEITTEQSRRYNNGQ